jgi:hypothetical protein
MSPVGFEPKIPTNELPQTRALDSAANGIDPVRFNSLKCGTLLAIQFSSVVCLLFLFFGDCSRFCPYSVRGDTGLTAASLLGNYAVRELTATRRNFCKEYKIQLNPVITSVYATPRLQRQIFCGTS